MKEKILIWGSEEQKELGNSLTCICFPLSSGNLAETAKEAGAVAVGAQSGQAAILLIKTHPVEMTRTSSCHF